MRTKQELARLREDAIRLRRAGKSRREIKEILGFIGNSTLNQILQDEPLPPERAGPRYAESRRRAADGVRRYWAVEGPVREAARAAISAAAAAQVGELTDREIILAGAIAYWCEGAKSKPYRIDETVRFVNSEPAWSGSSRPQRVAPEECAKRTSGRMRRYWAIERPVRAAQRAAARAAASAAAAVSVGDLTDREILIAGAVAYRCEGARLR